MSTEQIDSPPFHYVQVFAIADIAVQAFRHHLFEQDTRLKRLCASDESEPGHRLMQIIRQAVDTLDHLGTLTTVLREVSRWRAISRVEPPDYIALGAAFLTTLEGRLNAALPDTVREAWAAVYRFLAMTMQAAEVAA
jgi:hemoglobin-like flavoprotein